MGGGIPGRMDTTHKVQLFRQPAPSLRGIGLLEIVLGLRVRVGGKLPEAVLELLLPTQSPGQTVWCRALLSMKVSLFSIPISTDSNVFVKLKPAGYRKKHDWKLTATCKMGIYYLLVTHQ